MKQSKFSKFAALLLLSAINVSTAVMNSHPAFAAATKEKVSFPNKNIQLAGEIYLPDKFDSSKEYPAIVVVHPGGGVKEQTAGIYAQKLADKGFVTLTFDSSYQGESGGEVRYIHYVPNSLEEVPDGPNRAAFKEYYDYYRTPRGMHPNSPNLYRFTSLDKMFAYTAFDHVDWISPRPLLLIAGSKAASRYLSEDAYKMAKNPRELYIIPNATHIDLYDVPQYVDKAVTKLNSFYKKYL